MKTMMMIGNFFPANPSNRVTESILTQHRRSCPACLPRESSHLGTLVAGPRSAGGLSRQPSLPSLSPQPVGPNETGVTKLLLRSKVVEVVRGAPFASGEDGCQGRNRGRDHCPLLLARPSPPRQPPCSQPSPLTTFPAPCNSVRWPDSNAQA